MPQYASFPGPCLDNPFQIPWAHAMEDHGWKVCSPSWWPGSLIRNRKRIPLLLFHWPESYWRSENLLDSQMKAFKFRCMVRLAKSLGYKMVWSAHNVMPHEYLSERLERRMRRWILGNFDLIVGHSLNTYDDLTVEFGALPSPYVEAVHGHYGSLFAPSADKASLLRKYGMNTDKQKVFLMLSGKAYKGQLPFLEAWNAASTNRLQLVLAGRTPSGFSQVVGGLAGDVLHIGSDGLSHNMLADLLSCVDIMALPYSKITTSGAYFLALTCSVPVLAPNLPFFELHSSAGTALLYGTDGGVLEIERALSRLDQEQWEPDYIALQQLKQRFTWAAAGSRIAKAFDLLVGPTGKR